ncbi:MAG TPA: DUF805 domain-containing protein [Rhizomicrobium sp.]|nr:DUF805 domain-containing protein [Rhizomicrobium sp.]
MGQIDFNKLWANFVDLVQNHYMDFSGRLGRAQYWYFVLICVLVSIAAAIVDGIVGTVFSAGLIGSIVGLALLLPTGGASARRIQDSGNNGQFVWIYVIAAAITYVLRILLALTGPFGALAFLAFFFSIGWLISLVMIVVGLAVLYFCVQPGTQGDNQYGPPPPPWSPGA